MKYRVLIDQDEDGAYVVTCPALPRCMSQGNTRKEALANIKDAINGYIASLKNTTSPSIVRNDQRAKMKYRVLIDQDEDGAYVVTCPALPRCMSQGNTRKEAQANSKHAINGYIASLKNTTSPSIVRNDQRAKMKYRVLIDQDEDGAYVVTCPALPRCMS